MTDEDTAATEAPRRRPVVFAVALVVAIAGVGAWLLARPAGEPPTAPGGTAPAADSPFAAWKRLRDAFLAKPPKTLRAEILEQDGTSSWATTAEVTVEGDRASVSKHDAGAGGGSYEATFGPRSVTYSADAPKEVALLEPAAASLLSTWIEYGAGGALAAVFDDRANVESRLRAPATAIGPFVPVSVRPDPAGGTVVAGVIVSPKRRIEVTVRFGSDGRPTRRDLRDPTPPKLSSSVEKYSYEDR